MATVDIFKPMRLRKEQEEERQKRKKAEAVMRFIVVGKTGNGKSSVINTIAGEKLFEAKPSQTSVTRKCKFKVLDVYGSSLLVVDTPGLYDTDLEKDDTLLEIGKVMGITSPGFHGFIIVMRIGRYTEEESNTIHLLAEKFGPELYKRAVILFTSADDLKADGMTFDKYRENELHDRLKKIISKCDERTIAFDNRAGEEERKFQVQGLMDLIQDIMKSNNNTYYTNEIYEEVEKKIDEKRQEQLEANKTKTPAQVTNDLRKDLEEEKDFGEEMPKWFKRKFCIIL